MKKCSDKKKGVHEPKFPLQFFTFSDIGIRKGVLTTFWLDLITDSRTKLN